MPTYEYRCQSCDDTFELRRTMAESDAPATCPEGHTDTVRLLSAFAAVGVGDRYAPAPMPMGPGACGGECSCYPE